MLRLSVIALIAAFYPVVIWSADAPATPELIQTGRDVFEGNCAACHGHEGRGDGFAVIALKYRPRDFYAEEFRYISTDNSVASNADLARTVRNGRRNGQMPAFPYLPPGDVDAVVAYIRELNRTGLLDKLMCAPATSKLPREKLETISRKKTTPGAPVTYGSSPDFEFDVGKGKALFAANCAACHGPEGHGDAPQPMKDNEGRIIKARDLTREPLRSGDDPLEIFRRIRCGIPGTPMPAQPALNNDEIWQLVHFVRILGRN